MLPRYTSLDPIHLESDVLDTIVDRLRHTNHEFEQRGTQVGNRFAALGALLQPNSASDGGQ